MSQIDPPEPTSALFLPVLITVENEITVDKHGQKEYQRKRNPKNVYFHKWRLKKFKWG